MVKTRLSWFSESNNLLSSTQSGFRKNRGTIDNLARLENTIQIRKNNGFYTLAVMLDLEKAFDLLWVKGLLFKLHEMEIRGKMLSSIRAFLSNRKFRVQVGSHRSTLQEMLNGSSQGSILSPLLFIILKKISESILRYCLSGWYADDFVLWMKRKNFTFFRRKVEEDELYKHSSYGDFM